MMTTTPEEHLTLSAAAHRLPGNPDPSTLFRWGRRGLACADGSRAYLRLVRVGRKVFVTQAALDEFLAKVNAADDRRFRPGDVERAEQDAEADRVLDAAGI